MPKSPSRKRGFFCICIFQHTRQFTQVRATSTHFPQSRAEISGIILTGKIGILSFLHMKRLVLSSLFLACCFTTFADLPKLPFDEKSAAAFVGGENIAGSSSDFASRALSLYESKDLPAAEANLNVAKFLEYLGKSGLNVDTSLLAYFLSNPVLLGDFVSIVAPEDSITDVFSILEKIWKADPADFRAFPNLAVAIAIVFDTPPPATWPHSQVSEQALPRKFPYPPAAFKSIIEDRRKGRFLFPTEKLSVEEAKFLVASIAFAEDKTWAQRSLSTNVAGIAKLYSSIHYDTPRLNSKQFDWPDSRGKYSLETIKAFGGICTDQSYFTSEAAKAKGLPAFIFSGAGADGFHAWVAYMQKSGKWDFSVGRFASGRFVTGTTIDPQTWQHATNHSLQSLRDSFRRNPKYKTSELHAAFAEVYLANKKEAAAYKAATAAVQSDPRNFSAWVLLCECAKTLGNEPEITKICNNAIKAFARYPDNDAYFRDILIEKLISTGKKAEARKLSNAFVIKNKTSRPDLAMTFARRGLLWDIEDNDVKKLKTSYKQLFNVFKGDMAMTLNGIVIPVLQKLIEENKTDKVDEIVAQTRALIKTSKDETIASNFERVLASVKSGKTKKSE